MRDPLYNVHLMTVNNSVTKYPHTDNYSICKYASNFD
jgi:hypothetical protein